MENFRHLFQLFDFNHVCSHARRFHGVFPEEIAGESWIYQHLGKTEGQLRSALRREFKPEFSAEKLNSYAATQSQGKDPLDLLVELEDEIDRQKKQENDNDQGEAELDTARLAEALRVSRRRAQQIVRRRREQILAPGGQAELFGLRPNQ